MDETWCVALYARVSSQRQAEELTIQSQVAALRQRIARDGFSLEDERCFLDEGFSGSTLVRPALERLRDLAHCGGIDRLYVHSPDRLARRYVYQMLLLEEFGKQGVEIVFLNGDLEHQSPEGNLLLQMQGMFAEYERAKILERTRRGRRFAARQGKVSVLGHAPYGYRYVRKHEGEGEARYEIVLEEAKVVREVFRWVGLEGLSLGNVVERLKEQGILTATGNARCQNKGVNGPLLEESVWSDVRSLLQDPARLQQELDRRLERQPDAQFDASHREQSILKLKRRLARLVDAYENGWLEKDEFESRMSRAKERLDREQREYAELQRDSAGRDELRLVIGHFQMFAEQVASGLDRADFETRRGILKLLIKRIEVDEDEVRIVYKSNPALLPSAPLGAIYNIV